MDKRAQGHWRGKRALQALSIVDCALSAAISHMLCRLVIHRLSRAVYIFLTRVSTCTCAVLASLEVAVYYFSISLCLSSSAPCLSRVVLSRGTMHKRAGELIV
ncbi:unnamed protein product, partial [Sphacelaria rigidula]